MEQRFQNTWIRFAWAVSSDLVPVHCAFWVFSFQGKKKKNTLNNCSNINWYFFFFFFCGHNQQITYKIKIYWWKFIDSEKLKGMFLSDSKLKDSRNQESWVMCLNIAKVFRLWMNIFKKQNWSFCSYSELFIQKLCIFITLVYDNNNNNISDKSGYLSTYSGQASVCLMVFIS